MKNICGHCSNPVDGKKFCNMECYTKYKQQNQVTLTCSCGKQFSLSKKKAASASHCSRRCYIQSASEAGQRVCKDCKQLKSIDEFNTHSATKNIRRRYCVECEKKRSQVRSKQPRERWMAAKRRAASSGETWDILLPVFEGLISQACHYCGGELNQTGCGLDRKDNTTGYTESNVVPCCKQCNVVKNCFFSYKEMMMLSPTLTHIRTHRANRK